MNNIVAYLGVTSFAIFGLGMIIILVRATWEIVKDLLSNGDWFSKLVFITIVAWFIFYICLFLYKAL